MGVPGPIRVPARSPSQGEGSCKGEGCGCEGEGCGCFGVCFDGCVRSSGARSSFRRGLADRGFCRGCGGSSSIVMPLRRREGEHAELLSVRLCPALRLSVSSASFDPFEEESKLESSSHHRQSSHRCLWSSYLSSGYVQCICSLMSI